METASLFPDKDKKTNTGSVCLAVSAVNPLAPTASSLIISTNHNELSCPRGTTASGWVPRSCDSSSLKRSNGVEPGGDSRQLQSSCLSLCLCVQQYECQVCCAQWGRARPPVLLFAVCLFSGGSAAAACRSECSSHNGPRSRSPGQKHGAGQRPHHGASGGSDRQTGDGHDTPGASASLFQDARLRWKQPPGRAGVSHSDHTCTQRGERGRQPANERGGPHHAH